MEQANLTQLKPILDLMDKIFDEQGHNSYTWQCYYDILIHALSEFQVHKRFRNGLPLIPLENQNGTKLDEHADIKDFWKETKYLKGTKYNYAQDITYVNENFVCHKYAFKGFDALLQSARHRYKSLLCFHDKYDNIYI